MQFQNNQAKAIEVSKDGWVTYRQFPTLGYSHSIAFHSQDFGILRQTTNHKLEQAWSKRLKRIWSITICIFIDFSI
ncbi:unnamed protein product [Blepharisma stoltei]|uniref:Uncharacterized protein n=1 Tax=Blepharisma stoltei TaxID=1481888 RepID=A0AAU9IRQ8_9CILI|nr:unnamed protein product [Blepharisma stoltei]